MPTPPKISPNEVRGKLDTGGDLLLVCAYDSDEKFESAALEGAIPLSDLKSRESDLSKDRELVFY